MVLRTVPERKREETWRLGSDRGDPRGSGTGREMLPGSEWRRGESRRRVGLSYVEIRDLGRDVGDRDSDTTT